MRNRKIRGACGAIKKTRQTRKALLQLFEGLAEWDFGTLFLVHLWHQLLGDFVVLHYKGSEKVKNKTRPRIWEFCVALIMSLRNAIAATRDTIISHARTQSTNTHPIRLINAVTTATRLTSIADTIGSSWLVQANHQMNYGCVYFYPHAMEEKASVSDRRMKRAARYERWRWKWCRTVSSLSRDEHELRLTEQCKYLFQLFLFNIFRRKNKEN